MNHDTITRTQQFKIKHRIQARLRRIVGILACVVVFCTTYALILPALTSRTEVFCGFEEHVHDRDCYRREFSLVKTLDCEAHLTPPHSHSEECYNASGALICGKAEYYAHTHAEHCYDAAGELVCKLPEHSSHVHTEACYEPIAHVPVHEHGEECYTSVQDQLICTEEEVQGHSHDTACYEQRLLCTVEDENHSHEEACYELVLVCEEEERPGHSHGQDCYSYKQELNCTWTETVSTGDAFQTPQTHAVICGELEARVHVHGEECFRTTELVLTCKLPEDANHSHSELCYGDWKLHCTKTEHSHSLICYSDVTADVETEKDWLSSIDAVKNSGSWTEDMVAIAVSQLGYTESAKNYQVMDDGTVKGYTRYGQWYGDPYGDWCAMFVSFCMKYGGVKDIPTHSSCSRWVDTLSAEGVKLFRQAEFHNPLPGDIIFFDFDANGKSEHVGLVAEVIYNRDTEKAEKIKVIEGNSSNRVQYVTYKVDDTVIHGYGDVNRAYEEYRLTHAVDRIYNGDGFTATVSLEHFNGIPDDAELVVEKITPDLAPAVYEAAYAQAHRLLAEEFSEDLPPTIEDYILFDVGFFRDGQRLDPEGELKVTVSFTADGEIYETYPAYIVTFDKEGEAELPVFQKYTTEYDTITATLRSENTDLIAVLATDIRSQDYMARKDVAEENLENLDGTYALIEENFALLTEGTVPTVKELETVTVEGKTYIPKDLSLEIWTFTGETDNTYYISTEIKETTYYLSMKSGRLAALYLTENKQEATLWTAEAVSPELKLKGNGAYLQIDPRSTKAKTEEPSIGLYAANSYQALFDGQFGAHQYYSTTVTKYAGATRLLVNCDANNQVTLPTSLSSTGAYDYKVVGWYDIVNKKYYGEELLGTKITLTKDVILYPDYVAESYDIGQNVDVVQNQPKLTFVKNHMFDYNELFNTYGATYGGGNPNLNSSSSNTSGWDSNDWTTNSDGFNFVLTDWIHSRSENVDGNIGRPLSLGETNKVHNVNRDDGHSYTVDGKTIEIPNFAGITEPGIFNDTIKSYLFDPETTARGVHYLGEADMLYQYDAENGFYYYNSALNAASYNQSEQRFYVYNYTSSVENDGSINDFLPLNYGKKDNDKYDDTGTEVNFWFGMTSEISFYLPDEVGSAENVDAFGNDMQFRFSGDDDVWVFIDDQLVLDMGGVHDIVYGEINFRTGEVVIGEDLAVNTANPDNNFMPGVSGTDGVTTTNLDKNLITPGEIHTLTVYYMERGSSLSNNAIYFNIAPMYELEIIKRDAKGMNLLEGATFQVFMDEACTKLANMMVIDEQGNTTHPTSFTTDELGYILCSGLMAGRTYYIKEVSPPKSPVDHPGYPDMSKYIIRLDLAGDGEPTVILLNSDDQEWIFADAHRVSETGSRISLTVYDEAYVGGDAKVYVEKRWDEDDAQEHEPIRVQLLANGEPTGRYLVIGADTDWKGFYSELPEKDADGNVIEYTLQEINVPPGYKVSYTKLEVEDYVSTFTYSWEPATAFEAGQQYLLVTDNKVLATGTGDKLALSETSANALTNTAAGQAYVWTAEASGTGFYLKSGSGTYLSLYVSGTQRTFRAVSSPGTTSVLNIASNKLYGTQNNTKYYFRRLNANSYGESINRQNTGANFTLYKWTKTEIVTPKTYEGWLITNTLIPPEEKVIIPVRKIWHENVPADKIVPIEVELYLAPDDGGQATYITTMLLDQSNGWMDTFHDILAPEDGYHYYIRETNTGFITTYNGTLEEIQIGPEAGDTAMAMRVEPIPQDEAPTKNTAKPNTKGTPTEYVSNSLYFSFDTDENPAANWSQTRQASSGGAIGRNIAPYTESGYLVLTDVFNTVTIADYTANTGYKVQKTDHFEIALSVDISTPYDPSELILRLKVGPQLKEISLGYVQPIDGQVQVFKTGELGFEGNVEAIGFQINGYDIYADNLYVDYMYLGGTPEETEPTTTETEAPEPSDPEESTDPTEPSQPDEPDDPVVDPEDGVVITNRMETVDIPLEKLWDGVNPEIMNPITFRLYLVEESTDEGGTVTKNVTFVQSITLTKDEQWKNIFHDVVVPDDNAYYVVVENKIAGYQAFYDGETTQISIDGASPVTGARVDITDGQAVQVKLTNAPATELPSTGGEGLLLYTMGGALLTSLAVVLLMYSRKNKRRKGDFLQF